MTNFTLEIWLALGTVAAGGILAFLFCLAAVVRNQTHVHDLKVRVQSLRMEYQLQVQSAKDAASRGDVSLVPVAEIVPSAPARQAA